MSLTPGTRLGPYEVLSTLGAGGMGEVYRARDTKLKRDVALKLLPDSFASDPDRLARFEREAQVLASLNHPHIAAIHGFEQSAGTSALVMELVEGEDLSARLSRGPIPIEDAVPIARQIAEALEAAHEQGIVHRDLKPANIKVRSDGTVKVLDFDTRILAATHFEGRETPRAVTPPTRCFPMASDSSFPASSRRTRRARRYRSSSTGRRRYAPPRLGRDSGPRVVPLQLHFAMSGVR